MSNNNIFDTKDGYIDLEGMQKKADEIAKQRAEEASDRWNKQQEASLKQKDEQQKLFYKALQSNIEEADKRKAEELEEEKVRVMKEVEEKYESQGVKSEDTKLKDESYRKLLDGLKF